MLSWEEVEKYLPKYLSEESTETLFKELEQFPENIDRRMYTSALRDKESIFQGDGMICLPVVLLPDPTVHEMPAMIISNTCDNEFYRRYTPLSVQYAPIITLRKLIKLLRDEDVSEESIEGYINTIRKQRVSQIFYLPEGDGVDDESIVFFDKIVSCDNDIEKNDIKDIRIFSLSDYGFYLFLFKLSVHFMRIQEKVDRSEGNIL